VGKSGFGVASIETGKWGLIAFAPPARYSRRSLPNQFSRGADAQYDEKRRNVVTMNIAFHCVETSP